MKKIQVSGSIREAMVDNEDYEELSKYSWCALEGGKTTYAVRNIRVKGKRGLMLMHREILGLKDPKILVDHKDRDGLNNQKSNLRISNQSQNLCNRGSNIGSSSIYKGVSWHRSRGKWRARICKNGKKKYIGIFDSEKEAALAYDREAIKLHGEFARLNFPDFKHQKQGDLF